MCPRDAVAELGKENTRIPRRPLPMAGRPVPRPAGRRRFPRFRKGGKTTDIRIKSLAGEPCILQTDMENPVVKIGNAMLVPQGKGVYALDIRKGETVTITSQAAEASPIGPVEGKGGNFFGLP